MKRCVGAALMGVGLMWPDVARALSASDLLVSCETFLREVKTNAQGLVYVAPGGQECWTYMSAVQDATVLGDERLNRLLRVCSPPESTTMQHIRIFVEYARRIRPICTTPEYGWRKPHSRRLFLVGERYQSS